MIKPTGNKTNGNLRWEMCHENRDFQIYSDELCLSLFFLPLRHSLGSCVFSFFCFLMPGAGFCFSWVEVAQVLRIDWMMGDGE